MNKVYGAIYGDIMGSVYEFNNWKCMTEQERKSPKDYFFTDDTILTVATMAALIEHKTKGTDFKKCCRKRYIQFGLKYPSSYGGSFMQWLGGENDYAPYNSYGNGAPMRCSPCGIIAKTIDEAKELGRISASVTHNHPEGLKAAECLSALVWMARNGASKTELCIEAEKYYNLGFTLNAISPFYGFDETCQGTMPVALKCFFESCSFDDAMDKVIKIGGDTDTIGAITMAIAEQYYIDLFNITEPQIDFVRSKLPKEFLNIIDCFTQSLNV